LSSEPDVVTSVNHGVQQSAAPVPPLLLTQQHHLHLSITAGQFEDSAIEPLGIAAQSRPRKELKVIPQRWCIADVVKLLRASLPSVDSSESARSVRMINTSPRQSTAQISQIMLPKPRCTARSAPSSLTPMRRAAPGLDVELIESQFDAAMSKMPRFATDSRHPYSIAAACRFRLFASRILRSARPKQKFDRVTATIFLPRDRLRHSNSHTLGPLLFKKLCLDQQFWPISAANRDTLNASCSEQHLRCHPQCSTPPPILPLIHNQRRSFLCHFIVIVVSYTSLLGRKIHCSSTW
jgi:hypothetical protein